MKFFEQFPTLRGKVSILSFEPGVFAWDARANDGRIIASGTEPTRAYARTEGAKALIMADAPPF